jgi:hypothetical protein
MTPSSALTEKPIATATGGEAPPRPLLSAKQEWFIRLAVTLLLVVAYYGYRDTVVPWMQRLYVDLTGAATKPTTVGVWLVAGVLGALVCIWRHTLARDKRFHAPLLVTSILVIGDAGFGILENHYSQILATVTGGMVTKYSPTFVTILTTTLAEMLIGRFFFGKWPHLASAYVSGISAGILIKSNELWPFVMCGLISITSKYAIRIGDRHLWNPTNLGVTLMLFLATDHVASLSVQAGNEVWSVLVIWFLGGMILWNLKLLHISLTFVLAFIPLSIYRAWDTGNPILAELAPITSPMFQLYIFFMITDPKTITKHRWSQILVALLIAIMETVYRLAFRDKYSLYHALFTVGPIANLIEIGYYTYFAPKKPTSPTKG